MTPLRQRMIRAMDLRNLSRHTRRAYLNAVTGLAKHYRQSPGNHHRSDDRGLSVVSEKREGQRA